MPQVGENLPSLFEHLGEASRFEPDDQIARCGRGIEPPANHMIALGEKRLDLSDNGIGIFFREGSNPDQITDRMGSLRCGMSTNAQKIGYLPSSRQLWELKYTVFKCMQD